MWGGLKWILVDGGVGLSGMQGGALGQSPKTKPLWLGHKSLIN